MKTFNVWTEGWAANEGRFGATFMGSVEAENLVDACKKLRQKGGPASARYWRIEEKAAYYYGCKAFDNERDARKSFG